jgi:hypothetical protein
MRGVKAGETRSSVFLFLDAVFVFFLSGRFGFQNVFLTRSTVVAVAHPAIRAWPAARDSTS